MKIAVVAANGKAGQLIVEEAVKRGHDVTAIVRSENKTQAQHLLKKDLFDLTKEDLVGYDVVATAFGAWTPETLPLHSKSIEHFNDLLAGTSMRLLVVGGAGSLYVDKEKKVQLIVDEEVDPNSTVGFHPFVNTTTLNIAYADFLRFLEKAEHTVKRIRC